MTAALLLAGAVSLLLGLIRRFLVAKPLPGIPYSKTSYWFPAGDMGSLGVHFLRTQEFFNWLGLRCTSLNSPIVQLFIPSFSRHRPVVVIAHLPTVDDICNRRTREFDRGSIYKFWFDVMAPHATISMKTSDRSFKEQRRIWNGITSPAFMEAVTEPVFYDHIATLVKLWRAKARLAPGSAFSAGEDLLHVALDGIWRTLLGTELGMLEVELHSLAKPTVNNGEARFPHPHYPSEYRHLRTAITCMVWVTTGISPILYTTIFNVSGVLRRALTGLHASLDKAIDDSRSYAETGGPVRDLLDLVFQRSVTQLEQTDDTTSRDNLRSEILELLVTGHESTGNASSWALKLLSDNPKAQEKLRSIVQKRFPGCTATKLPSCTDITTASIPYLDATVAEVLRASCSGSISFRETTVDCQVMGHVLPAGTPIALVANGPSYAAGGVSYLAKDDLGSARAKFQRGEWDDTHPMDRFMPERWLAEDGSFSWEAGPNLPFMTGVRGCVGRKVALAELKMILIMLLLSFRFPQLDPRLSKYSSYDSFTRQPTCCYVRPEIL